MSEHVLKLQRVVATTHGVFGKLGKWYVCEEEAQGNARGVSAIPAGTYLCTRSRYHKGGYDTFEVTGVPGRSRILFHKGNTEEDTEGCILLGLGLGVLWVRDEDLDYVVPKLAVTSSASAFAEFMRALKDMPAFKLEIRDPLV